MTDRMRVLVLGGGVGGIATANALRRRLPGGHEVTLVERLDTFVFAPSLLWVMVGARRPEQISRPLRRLVHHGVGIVTGEVERIDAGRREVTIGGRAMVGDHLVISLGAATSPELIPGLREAGHDFYTLAGAIAFRDRLSTLEAGRVVLLTAAPAYRCPAAPYEAALLVDAACRSRGRSAVQVELFAAEPGPMGVAGPQVSAAVRQMVERRGIAYHPEHQVTRVDPVARRIEFSNGASTTYDLLGFVPPHQPPRVVRDSGLAGGETGWISVDRGSLATRFPGVHAIGDVTSIPLKMGKPLPKAGVFAHGQAQVVARNIARAVLGKGQDARFDGAGECFIETGGGKAGMGKGDFYAEPAPVVALHQPSRRWHLGKVLVEQTWLHGWV